jgi:hypothetical protein
MGGLKNNSRVARIHGEKNKIQIAHVLFRYFDIWDSPVSSIPQPYQVGILGAGSKIKSSSHKIAHVYFSKSLTSGTHLSAGSSTFIKFHGF